MDDYEYKDVGECTCPGTEDEAPEIFMVDLSCPIHSESVKRMIRLPEGDEIQL